jgi:predicted DNA-binding protein (UPF0251 family)
LKGWGWRWRRGPGRPPKPRFLSFNINSMIFIPHAPDGRPIAAGEPIVLAPDEVEALRLVYLEGLRQEEAAERMGISRGTLWRTLDSARRKLVRAIIEGRPIVIEAP